MNIIHREDIVSAIAIKSGRTISTPSPLRETRLRPRTWDEIKIVLITTPSPLRETRLRPKNYFNAESPAGDPAETKNYYNAESPTGDPAETKIYYNAESPAGDSAEN